MGGGNEDHCRSSRFVGRVPRIRICAKAAAACSYDYRHHERIGLREREQLVGWCASRLQFAERSVGVWARSGYISNPPQKRVQCLPTISNFPRADSCRQRKFQYRLVRHRARPYWMVYGSTAVLWHRRSGVRRCQSAEQPCCQSARFEFGDIATEGRLGRWRRHRLYVEPKPNPKSRLSVRGPWKSQSCIVNGGFWHDADSECQCVRNSRWSPSE